MKLTRQHLRELWLDNCIAGFIEKDRTREMLEYSPVGTFMIRFSDSMLGKILIIFDTICYILILTSVY